MFAFNAQNVIDNSYFEFFRAVLGHVQSHFELAVILFDFYHLQQKFGELILDTSFLTLLLPMKITRKLYFILIGQVSITIYLKVQFRLMTQLLKLKYDTYLSIKS